MGAPPGRRHIQTLACDKCSVGCEVLDAFLGGGVSCGSITELAGEATTCKTQICLQALIQARLSLGGSSVYIYTEGDPPLDRLRQLAVAAAAAHSSSTLLGTDLVSGVYVERGVDSGAALLERVRALRTLLDRAAGGPAPVRLLVIDSLAGPLRDLGPVPALADLLARTELLFQLAATLRQLADQYSLAVLVTNQVTDVVEGGGLARAATGGNALTTSGRAVAPALGLAWAACLNTRIFLAREPEHGGEAGEGGTRSAHVVWSPELPPRRCAYVVDAAGVRGVHPSAAPTG